MSENSIVGKLINFRGLVYSPINEQGVVFLFGRVLDDLNMYIEEVRTAYPDCVARRYTGRGWERVYIEFEYQSSNFLAHKHDPEKCNIVVCWEHDWKECPVEVIELQSVIKELENKSVEEPTKSTRERGTEISSEKLFESRKTKENIKLLYKKFANAIKSINDDIWGKITKTEITFYSPEKVFFAVRFRQNTFQVNFFTDKNNIKGVRNIKNHENWGTMIVKNGKDLLIAIEAAKSAYTIMKGAIRENKNTGWYAETPRKKIKR